MCASQPGQTAKMEFLARVGADVNGLCWGWFPVIFCPCENVQPEPLKWLLDHGTDANCIQPKTRRTALDYLSIPIPALPSGSRRASNCSWPREAAHATMFLAYSRSFGAAPPNSPPCLTATHHWSTVDALNSWIAANPVAACSPHVAPPSSTSPPKYGFFEATRLLLDRGADVNARADVDANGIGGQTPIFHALTHFMGVNPQVGELLKQRGADLAIRARVPGHCERPGEILDVSAAEYAAIFPLR